MLFIRKHRPVSGSSHANKGAYGVRIRFGVGAVLSVLSMLLSYLAREVPGFGQWHVTHVYPVLVNILARFADFFPFSVSEILLYCVLIFALIDLAMQIFRREISSFVRMLSRLFLTVSILFFLYVVCCGINYYRTPFSEEESIAIVDYSASELADCCRFLTDEINKDAGDVARNSDGVLIVSQNTLRPAAREVMAHIAESYPSLSGFYPAPKPFAISCLLSVQEVTGIYLPFVIEANYNRDMPSYNIPATMCHELSHLRGFMDEKEANFIAYLACSESDDIIFRYSGNLFAWVYCMNELHRADRDTWRAVRNELSPFAEADLQANNTFWAEFEDSKASEIQSKVNDTYLKANGQSAGVRGYDRMVDLVVSRFLSDRKQNH